MSPCDLPELGGTSHSMTLSVMFRITHTLSHTVTVVSSAVPKPAPWISSVGPPPKLPGIIIIIIHQIGVL